MQRVVVLLKETVGSVGHMSSEMPNDEALIGHQLAAARHGGKDAVGHRLLVLFKELLDKRLVCALGQLALLVEQRKEADGHIGRAVCEHVDAGLVARLFDRVEHDSLAQRLVCEVDAQLLKRVGLELLESEDVEHADEGARTCLGEQRRVDAPNQPIEELGVHGLGEGVARVGRLLRLEWDLVYRVGERAHRALGQRLLKHVRPHLEQLSHSRHCVRRADITRILVDGAKADVAHVEQSGQQHVDAVLLCSRDADGAHRCDKLSVRGLVVDGIDPNHPALEVVIVFRIRQPERRLLGGRQAGEKLVKAVVVALLGRLHDRARLLKQVCYDVSAHQPVALIKVNARELAEARRVVIHDRLRIAERLKDRVAVQNLLAQAAQLLRHTAGLVSRTDLTRLRRAAHGQVLHHNLSRLGLARAGLARDHDRLRRAVHLHRSEGAVGHCVKVRRQKANGLPAICLHHLVAIAGELLIRIHGDQNIPSICVYEVFGISAAQVVEERRLVQVHQLRIVVDAIQVVRVHRLGDGTMKSDCLRKEMEPWNVSVCAGSPSAAGQ
eukprot:scaffold27473_cov118-Isochrysis_galbana.AAC.2